MLTAATFITLNDKMNNSMISKIYFQVSFLFKNSLVKVIYLLTRCCKTRFVLLSTNNTIRNCVNKENTHTHTHTHTPNTQRKITLERVS